MLLTTVYTELHSWMVVNHTDMWQSKAQSTRYATQPSPSNFQHVNAHRWPIAETTTHTMDNAQIQLFEQYIIYCRKQHSNSLITGVFVHGAGRRFRVGRLQTQYCNMQLLCWAVGHWTLQASRALAHNDTQLRLLCARELTNPQTHMVMCYVYPF